MLHWALKGTIKSSVYTLQLYTSDPMDKNGSGVDNFQNMRIIYFATYASI